MYPILKALLKFCTSKYF